MSSIIVRAIIAAVLVGGCSALQSYVGSGAPQLIVGGVNILVVIGMILHALESQPSGVFGRAAKKGVNIMGGMLCVLSMVVGGGAVLGASACTPAQYAVFTQVEQRVLADLSIPGEGLPQVEADVATLLAGQPGADVVAIVNEALQLLVDLNVIPANLIPTAKRMIAEGNAKLALRSAK